MLVFQRVCLKRVGVSLYNNALVLNIVQYILGLRSSWGTSRARPAWSLSGHILTPALSPFWGTHARCHAPPVEVVYTVVLMAAAHISPNIFSLQPSLTNVYWTSYYKTRQCTHTYYTSQSHKLLLYYIILHDTLKSISHLHFFCSSWQAGSSQLLVSDTIVTLFSNGATLFFVG